MKKTQQHKNTVNISRIFLHKSIVILAGILIVSQLGLDFILWKTAGPQNPGVDTIVLTHMISSAVDGLNKPAPVDAPSNRVFIPEARVVLPANKYPLGQTLYQFEKGDGTKAFPEVIHITNSTQIERAKNKMWLAMNRRSPMERMDVMEVLNAVPKLQACVRGVQVYFHRQDNQDFTYESHKTLADGRELYIYTEPLCSDELASIVDMAKGAESY